MFSKFRKKDSSNELRRVNSNDSVKSGKSARSAFKSIFSFHTDGSNDSVEQELDSHVSRFLQSNGLPQPKVLFNQEIKLSAANDYIFLPTLTRDDEEDLNNDDLDDGSDNVTHTFAFVLSVPQPTKLALELKLKCICKNFWPMGIPDSPKGIKSETFQLGEMSFDLSLQNYNMFMPLNTNGMPSYNEHIIPMSKYKPFILDDVIESEYYRDTKPQVRSNKIYFPPGEYVYLVPISFPLNIPESVITEHASINYLFDLNMYLDESKEYFVEHFINLIRSPPAVDTSTYNKPIYINKQWDDALNYEISFPKKFVSIGEEEVPIKLNFIPLAKHLNISKIRVNLLQKISYLNKEMNHQRFELDETKYKNGHTVSLLEIRPSDAKFTSFAAKEDIVEIERLKNRNFLTCSYSGAGDSSDSDSEEEEIIGPLHIKSHITFLKPAKPSRFYKENNFFSENVHLTDLLVHKNRPQVQTKVTKPTVINQIPFRSKVNPQFIDGLLPSSNTNYIHIQHKLQICLRIMRKTDKVHNYEVLIDTPIYLLNSACTPESIELPPYIDSNLPSFEEATSPMSSPVLSPYEETYLSRTSTIISQQAPFCDDTSDLVDQIDDLVLNNHSLDIRRGSTGSIIVNNLMRTMSKDPPTYNEVKKEEDEEVDYGAVDLSDQYSRR